MDRALIAPFALLLAVAAAVAAAETASPEPAVDASRRPGFLRGMVISCPRDGRIWGSPDMAASLETLRGIGVGWVAIHPYAWLRRDGLVQYTPAADTGYLDRAAAMTSKAGVDLFLKPHVGYWGSFSWRGDIAFGADEAAWRHFFDGYRSFIVDQARFAQRNRIPLLAVGVELERTVHREAEWRRIIAEVRAVYDGEIIYAANWDRIDAVPFWDAVDAIGVHAYFPVSEVDDPDWQAIWHGWERHLGALRELSLRHGAKPVVIAEIGYNRSPASAREPWAYEVDDTPESRALRRRLIEVALLRLEGEPMIRGMFWWKWMPGTWRPRNFSMHDREALEALERHWLSASGADRRPTARDDG